MKRVIKIKKMMVELGLELRKACKYNEKNMYDYVLIDDLNKLINELNEELIELCLGEDTIHMAILKAVEDTVKVEELNRKVILDLDTMLEPLSIEEEMEVEEMLKNMIRMEEPVILMEGEIMEEEVEPAMEHIPMFIEPSEELKAMYSGKNSLKPEASKIYKYNPEYFLRRTKTYTYNTYGNYRKCG